MLINEFSEIDWMPAAPSLSAVARGEAERLPSS